MTSYIICAFVSGFLLATVIFWMTTRQLQKDWQAEYRRLMGGVKDAHKLVTDFVISDDGDIPEPAACRLDSIQNILFNLFMGHI